MKYLSLQAAAFSAAAIRSLAKTWQRLDDDPAVQGRSVALVLVIGVHLAGLWIFLHVKPPIALPSEHEVQMVLSPFGPAPSLFPPPQMEVVAPGIVPLPDIQIAEEAQPNPIAFAAADTQLIAPRPDPAHPNDPPAGDGPSASARCAGEVVLRILVLADGTIGDAAVAKSCGAAEPDQLALLYAKTHWHYLPATLGGEAVQDWTTVIVPFR